jgi:FtsH-binding integral membrane protein
MLVAVLDTDVRAEVERLALVVVVDALFVVGVLLPYLTYDGGVVAPSLPEILSVPLVLTVFLLPWATVGSVAFSGYRLWRGGPLSRMSRGICLGVVVLGIAGLVMYFSPSGVDALRWHLD